MSSSTLSKIRYSPESAKGNSEKRTSMITISQIENITGMQYKDAMRMQLDLQRQVHGLLESQRWLQLHIEEGAKKLKKMFDERANNSQNLEITTMNLEDDDILNLEADFESTLFLSKI